MEVNGEGRNDGVSADEGGLRVAIICFKGAVEIRGWAFDKIEVWHALALRDRGVRKAITAFLMAVIVRWVWWGNHGATRMGEGGWGGSAASDQSTRSLPRYHR